MRLSERTRIVQVIDDLHGGGAQAQLIELVRSLDRDEFDVTVCALSVEKVALLEKLRAAGIEVTLIRQGGMVDLAAFRRLRRHLGERRPHLVQTWLFTADLYGRLAALLARIPLRISSIRSPKDDKTPRQVRADRMLVRFTDRFIVNAAAVGQRLIERERVPPDKIVTIYNGVDTGLLGLAPARLPRQEEWGFPAAGLVVGYVGRLQVEKRPDLFLEMAAAVARSEPSARFVMVGEGPLRDELGRRVAAEGLGPVFHLGRFASRIAEVLHSIDLLVSTSDFEGCSNVILEAMAAGRAVVATDVGGNRELIVEGVTGWLVPAGRADLLAAAVAQALADPARLRAAGDAGQRRARAEFSLERMVERHEELYRSLLGGRRPAAAAGQ